MTSVYHGRGAARRENEQHEEGREGFRLRIGCWMLIDRARRSTSVKETERYWVATNTTRTRIKRKTRKYKKNVLNRSKDIKSNRTKTKERPTKRTHKNHKKPLNKHKIGENASLGLPIKYIVMYHLETSFSRRAIVSCMVDAPTPPASSFACSAPQKACEIDRELDVMTTWGASRPHQATT